MFTMDFDVEKYLNNLPDDIKEIHLNNMGLKELPDLSRFKNLEVLMCSNNELTFLPELNENLLELWCSNNKLKDLPKLGEKLRYLSCYNNEFEDIPKLNKFLTFVKWFGKSV